MRFPRGHAVGQEESFAQGGRHNNSGNYCCLACSIIPERDQRGPRVGRFPLGNPHCGLRLAEMQEAERVQADAERGVIDRVRFEPNPVIVGE